FFSNLKKYDLAVSQFLSVPADADEFLKSRIGAVSILQQTRKYAQASLILEDILERSEYQEDLNLWLLQVKLFHEQRKFSELKKLLPQLLEKFPNEQMLMLEYAVVLQELNQDQECLQILDQLLAVNPNHQEALNFIAYTYAEAGIQLDLAHRYVDQALKFDPQNPYFIDTKAWVFYKQGKYQEALEQMDRALIFLPDDPVLLEHYGDILLELGKGEESQVYFQKSLVMSQESDENNEMRKLKQRLKLKVKK
ncbi:MAG: tetratricopeptide repeat protein, partial [Candidatus Paceibacterota bacterium]